MGTKRGTPVSFMVRHLGNEPLCLGVLLGSLFSCLVAVLTFIEYRGLPYPKMLVLTGILLGLALIVIVGDQAQKMQFAHQFQQLWFIGLSDGALAWIDSGSAFSQQSRH
ncbi:hypothetical protein [Edaphobacter dinghuensis]|uniref:hypothetical protein n=1 Tax=Edaphobacter dinghuensis TaxID=1560005 RepID=UPI00166E1A7D|nr:hypothetical protein [Edaphobacter dinghuensis]